MPTKGTISALVLGSIGIVSVSFLFYYFFYKQPSASSKRTVLKVENSGEKPNKSDESRSSKVVAEDVDSSDDEADNGGDVDVDGNDDEDEDGDDDDEVETDNKDAEAAKELLELKAKYDDTNRLATKLISGRSWERAIEKLTDALELAPRLPSASKDIMTLYNNRSASYEKVGIYDKALLDITIVLAMDPYHLKARARRARIFEAQNKPRQALEDYVLAVIIQQQKLERPSHQEKVDAIVKSLAIDTAPSLLQKVRTNTAKRSLPTRAYCRNYLESYPSYHAWKEFHSTATTSTGREDLLAVFNNIPVEEPDQIRAANLNIICADITNNAFTTAFKRLSEMSKPELSENDAIENIPPIGVYVDGIKLSPLAPYCTPGSDTDLVGNHMASLQMELIGSEHHLKCQLNDAISAFRAALHFMPLNIDARLKLASSLLEDGDTAGATALYDELLHFLESANVGTDNEYVSVLKVWTLLHRASIFVTRDTKGAFPENAISLALGDIDAVLAATETLTHYPAGKAARVSAYIRSIHVLMQSKQNVGETVTEDDHARNQASIVAAKKLDPTNDSVLMMEVEMASVEGNTEKALRLVEAAESRPGQSAADTGDCTTLFIKASVIVGKAMGMLQNPDMMNMVEDARALLAEANAMYTKALALEPNAIEVLSQFAQFKAMLGEVEEAITMLNQAMELARTRDDVQDLNQLLILNDAQWKAMQYLKKASG